MAEPGLYGSVSAAATSGTQPRRNNQLIAMVAVVTLCSLSAIAYFGTRTDSLEGLPDGKHYLMNMLRDEAPLLHRRHNEMAAISSGSFSGAGLADPTIMNGMANSLDQGTPDQHVKLAQSTTAYNNWIQAQQASQLMANSPIKAKTQMLLDESDYYGYGGDRHSALFDNSMYNNAMTSGLFTMDTSVQSLSQASGPSSPLAPSFMVGPGQMPAAGSQLVAKCAITFPVQALALQPQATVTISLENAPVGASLTNVVAANPGSSTFSYSPLPGGAAARPFITHHNSLDIPLYMRIANELYLKRLIVGGFDGVYEFSKNFRNEGMDRTHTPEFTAMEIYVAYKDYNWMMEMTENLLEYCANQVNGTTEATFGEHKVNFKAPYARVTMTDAIKQFTGFDIT